jgi:hypothetical protein
MKRTHTFVRLREIQSLLARVTSEIQELEAKDLNYQLDLEFSKEFDQLVERYGYSNEEVVRLVEVVRELESQGDINIGELLQKGQSVKDTGAQASAVT